VLLCDQGVLAAICAICKRDHQHVACLRACRTGCSLPPSASLAWSTRCCWPPLRW
jgi:hypothetical protein